jgi:hypothetical protein
MPILLLELKLELGSIPKNLEGKVATKMRVKIGSSIPGMKSSTLIGRFV